MRFPCNHFIKTLFADLPTFLHRLIQSATAWFDYNFHDLVD